MAIHTHAGKPAQAGHLTDVPRLVAAYYDVLPEWPVAFGTSGHRGSSHTGSFNEGHILAIAQAVCDYRRAAGNAGPLLVGMDTHALSGPSFRTALEVFAANDVWVWLQKNGGYTPTPVISHAILECNQRPDAPRADGVIITPSHNPPTDGGFKYNPPSGGPAGAETTQAIEHRANELLQGRLRGVRRIPYERAKGADTTQYVDLRRDYVAALDGAVDMNAIRDSGLKIGVDPMGGAAVAYWDLLAETYQIDLTVVNTQVDPTFGFMTLDHDGKIRMDCSSSHAMASLIALKDQYDIAFGNDPDVDRHGIVTQSRGLMNPNHYLAVAVSYLFQQRSAWLADTAVAKTLVSSSIIDRIAASMGRRLVEVPVGFKWFVQGLLDGEYGFAGEESAGASFLQREGVVWTTDKDGIVMGLLAAEIMAVSGRDPSEWYARLEHEHGSSVYERIDAPATPTEKDILRKLSPGMVKTDTLAGEPVLQKLTRAPGNNAPIGGLKVTTRNGWFAARPSGTEDIYKIYAESFLGPHHLATIQEEARAIVATAFREAGSASPQT